MHIKVRFKDRKLFQNFLRTYTGLLARKLTQAHRGHSFGKFWDGIAYTRVLFTKLEELGLKIYFEGNHRERELGRGEREIYLKSWNQFFCIGCGIFKAKRRSSSQERRSTAEVLVRTPA